MAAKNIVLVGGGPVGVEMAAEIVESYAGKSEAVVPLRQPAYKTLIRTPYVQIRKALYDPYKRVGLAEPLVVMVCARIGLDLQGAGRQP
jgi:hypothetical protein